MIAPLDGRVHVEEVLSEAGGCSTEGSKEGNWMEVESWGEEWAREEYEILMPPGEVASTVREVFTELVRCRQGVESSI